MSGVKVGGVWRQPAQTFVKVAGTWRTVSTVSVKQGGVWRTTDFAGPPATPILTYTGDRQFTISGYSASLVYTVTGASAPNASGIITNATNDATVTASYAVGAPASAARIMKIAAHARVLDAYQTTVGGVRCGWNPWDNPCCPNGWIANTDGSYCGGSGTYHNDYGSCGGLCTECFTLYMDCYSWHWTDYSGSNYTLYGSNWGKAV